LKGGFVYGFVQSFFEESLGFFKVARIQMSEAGV